MRDPAIATNHPLADVASAWSRVRADPTFQFDLPAVQQPEPPAWLRWLIHNLDWAGALGRALFWLTVAAAAVAIVAYGIRLALRMSRRRRPRAEAAPEAWQPQARVARALLDEADAIAALGDYGAAARLLLHRSLEDVGRHRPALLRPAATTREIGGAGDFPVAARAAFAPIAAAVERSLFGGRVLPREEWEAARAAYRRFALPDVWA